jgi:diaminopimelate decarboxylase
MTPSPEIILRPPDHLQGVIDIIRNTNENPDTPFYIYDVDGASAALSDLMSLLGRTPIASSELFLPVFANPCFPLLDCLVSQSGSVGLLVNSLPELESVHRYAWAKRPAVAFAGGVLSPAQVKQLRGKVDWFYASSLSNLREALVMSDDRLKIGLRIDLSDNGELRGVPARDVFKFCQDDPASAASIAAIHAYQGPSTPSFDACFAHGEALMQVARWFPSLRQINFSGGWPFDYSETDCPLPSSRVGLVQYLANLAKAIADVPNGNALSVAFEPGKFLLAAYGYFICRVIECFPFGVGHLDVHLDSSFVHLPSLKIKNRQHAATLLKATWVASTAPAQMCRLRGCTGLSTDFLMPGSVLLPTPQPGDFLAIHDMGVYGWAGSYNFLGLQRPAEFLCRNGKLEFGRSQQRVDHLLEGIP